MTEPIYIVAGSFEQYRKYCFKKKAEYDERGETFPLHQFVSNVDRLRGLKSIKGFYIGTYEKRSDIDVIKWQIAAIKSRNV